MTREEAQNTEDVLGDMDEEREHPRIFCDVDVEGEDDGNKGGVDNANEEEVDDEDEEEGDDGEDSDWGVDMKQNKHRRRTKRAMCFCSGHSHDGCNAWRDGQKKYFSMISLLCKEKRKKKIGNLWI